MTGPGIEPVLSIVDGDAAANLHAARPSNEGCAGRLVIARAKFDDVSTLAVIATVARGKPSAP